MMAPEALGCAKALLMISLMTPRFCDTSINIHTAYDRIEWPRQIVLDLCMWLNRAVLTGGLWWVVLRVWGVLLRYMMPISSMPASVGTIVTSAHWGWMEDALAKIIGCHNRISFYHVVTVKCTFYNASISPGLITKVRALVWYWLSSYCYPDVLQISEIICETGRLSFYLCWKSSFTKQAVYMCICIYVYIHTSAVCMAVVVVKLV